MCLFLRFHLKHSVIENLTIYSKKIDGIVFGLYIDFVKSYFLLFKEKVSLYKIYISINFCTADLLFYELA